MNARFRFLADPLFLVCFAAYWINRWLENRGLSPNLFQWYLNDLICIPFWVPIMLWASRRCGLREDDRPPEAYEIAIPLVMWSAVFEVLLPATNAWSGRAVADPYDVFCYSAGALGAACFWRLWYRRQVGNFAVT